MQGYDDRGFILMKRYAQSLCDSENQESIDAGLEIYKELWPMLFENEMMTMNYDMMETYIKELAKQTLWKQLIEAKKMIIKYFRETKSVDHKTRRAFLEIVSVQVL